VQAREQQPALELERVRVLELELEPPELKLLQALV
jgi:hypothetical protein